MKKLLTIITTLAMALGSYAGEPLELWYDKPAGNWNEALPLGNGRIAAMVYGNPVCEEYQLNEETISKGSPYKNYNAETPKYLDNLRQLVFSGKSDEAQALAETQILADRDYGFGASYQPAGSLRIEYDGHKDYSSLRRQLSIDNAVSTVTYRVGDVTYTEEAFTSFTDQMLIIRVTASKKGAINLKASLFYPDGVKVDRSVSGNTLALSGTTAKAANNVPGKLNFIVNAKIDNEGGAMTQNDTALIVKDADAVTFHIAMATNFVNYKDISADPQKRIDEYMKNAGRDYETAKAEHIEYYKEQFDRVSLDLGDNSNPSKTTDKRIEDFAEGNDTQLVELYFQFGRYLLICSSQPGCQPANLQGKWNGSTNPAWKCRYTVNINTEMNYWPAESTNLPDKDDKGAQRDRSRNGKEHVRMQRMDASSQHRPVENDRSRGQSLQRSVANGQRMVLPALMEQISLQRRHRLSERGLSANERSVRVLPRLHGRGSPRQIHGCLPVGFTRKLTKSI